ncbi:6551_t:CDS:2, partial [Racocetra persica]
GCALMNDESADLYRWVLYQTKQATGGYVPAIIMTDADLALDLAIFEEYEQSYAMHYFYTARNSLVPEVFKQKWKQLIKKYNEPRVVKYLKTLNSSKKAWTQILLTSSAAILPQTLFSELDKALSWFITPEIQKIQRAEIKSCLNYYASAITKDEMIKYQE